MSPPMIKPTSNSIPASVLVVSFNEKEDLHECLRRVRDFAEIVVVDLGSTDGSDEVAEKMATRLIRHERVPTIETLLPRLTAHVSLPWVLRLDPDEWVEPSLISDIQEMLRLDHDSGIIEMPMQYYFRGKRVRTTVWGGIRYVARMFHRDRVSFKTDAPVHSNFITPAGQYKTRRIQATDANVIRHMWVHSLGDLWHKHRRYIELEAEARRIEGFRFTWLGWIRSILGHLKQNLLDLKGIRGGPTGVFLSFFYSWYVGMYLWEARKPRNEARDVQR